MRSSILPFLPLLVATFLLMADGSTGSPTIPTNHDRHKDLIDAQIVPARSSDAPSCHAVTRMAALDGENRHLQRGTDMPNPSNQPSLALMQRHNHITDQLRLHSGGSSPAKRSLAGDLKVMGFILIWDHANVIVSSYLGYYRTIEYYMNITILAGGEFKRGYTVLNYIITYGAFRLVFTPVVDAMADIAAAIAEVFPNGFGQFMREFAEVMLTVITGVLIGTFAVLASGVRLSIWITMTIVEHAQTPPLVTWPLNTIQT